MKFNDVAKQWQAIEHVATPDLMKVLESGNYTSGRWVEKFEAAFAKYADVSEVIAVNSGTSALHAGLVAIGIKPGDLVGVPAFTFIASATSIIMAGAIPVLIDIDPESGLLSEEKLVEILNKTDLKALIYVHLYGHVGNIQKIKSICDSKSILLIEDCAQAHGAKFEGRPVGNFGIIGCYSFYPGKSLGGIGEGGAVITNSSKIALEVRNFRNWGSPTRYHHTTFGLNYRMDEIQAVVLFHKLQLLPTWQEKKARIAEMYSSLIPIGMRLNTEVPGGKASLHLYVIKVANRAKIVEALDSQNIPYGLHYPKPLQEQGALVPYVKVPFNPKFSAVLANSVLSLPLHPWIEENDVERVVRIIGSSQV
jgi:dTDP-4-amino-4,6-dideoxygalactose transaminase